ncbi:MAG: hypothetical protein IJ007_05075 [Oscillospiraceae bacterium]|nr:hypothetical protein [Oscillospiraceae bacterium]
MTKINHLVYVFLFLISAVNNYTNIEIITPDLINKAEELYCYADGINSEKFISADGVFYLNGDKTQITLDERITEYTDVFTDKKCREIFSGKRSRNNVEYRIDSYGITSDGSRLLLTADDILNRSFEKYDSVMLFSVVRGADLSFEAGGYEIKEAADSVITIKYTALYSGSHDDGTEYELEYKNGTWNILSSSDKALTGTEYVPYPSDKIKEYEFKLVHEDDKWKFDEFTLWY